MIIETELKLTIDTSEIERFITLPFLEENSFKPVEHYALCYTYYDTETADLFKQGFALRVRLFEDHYIQTIKTTGKSVEGLHQREEYHHSLNSAQPDINFLPSETLKQALMQNQKKLIPVFVTDMRRISWYIAFENTQIEIALDQGVIQSNEKTKLIHEVELELISGDAEGLRKVAEILRKDVKLIDENKSKAEYGYRLFFGETTE